MNYKMISKLIGRLLMVEGLLLVLPIIVGIIYKEPSQNLASFAIVIAILLVLGFLLNLPKAHDQRYYTKEGLIVIAISWILMSLLGGLPLYLSGYYPTIIDGFFELSSGLTTTGASVALDVEALPHSILFWRSFSHFVGGMGVLVFALAVTPQMNKDNIHLMKAEVPGPVFGKIVSRLGDTARLLYLIYLVMTIVLILILWAAGMPFFDSMLHAFGTAGTGGFGIKASSVQYYNSPAIEYILGVGMIVFGVNFSLYYLILLGKIKEFFKNEELKWYLGIIAAAVILIVLNVYSTYGFGRSFRDAFFTVSSIITTTGYTTVDFDTWPLFSEVILLVLMFIGGCAGSTAGGIKVSRIAIMIKSGFAEIKRSKNPNRVVNVIFEEAVVDRKRIRNLANYMFLYATIFVILLLIISLDLNTFDSAFSAAAAIINNVGPGLGIIGPSGSFAVLSQPSKFILAIGMIAGRLEILPVIILFSPNTWKRV